MTDSQTKNYIYFIYYFFFILLNVYIGVWVRMGKTTRVAQPMSGRMGWKQEGEKGRVRQKGYGNTGERFCVLWGAVKARGPCHEDLSIKQVYGLHWRAMVKGRWRDRERKRDGLSNRFVNIYIYIYTYTYICINIFDATRSYLYLSIFLLTMRHDSSMYYHTCQVCVYISIVYVLYMYI